MRVRSGACPWARRANPNASPEPPLRPLNATDLAQNGQPAQASHTAHGKAPDRSIEMARRRAHTTGCRRRTHDISTRIPRSRAAVPGRRSRGRATVSALVRCTRTRQHTLTEVCPRLLHKVSVSLSPLSRVAGRRVELIWPTRWVRRAGASDPHAGHTQRAAVLMGGHTAFSTNRHEAQPRRTSDAAEAGSVDAAHGRPVTVRQGSGHMCVCRRVRAEPEPQPARERTGSSEMPDGVGARGERQKLQRACNWKHTFHAKTCQEKRVLC